MDLKIRGRRVKLEFVADSSGKAFDRMKLAEAVLTGRGYPLPIRAEQWLKEVCADQEASGAIVATTCSKHEMHNKELIGFVRWSEDAESIRLLGTYVLGGYRSRGVARRMWEEAIDYFDPQKTVEVVAMSTGGLALVQSLQMRHPQLKWEIDAHI